MRDRVTLYTGNDDHTVLDLLQPFAVRSEDGQSETRLPSPGAAFAEIWEPSYNWGTHFWDIIEVIEMRLVDWTTLMSSPEPITKEQG